MGTTTIAVIALLAAAAAPGGDELARRAGRAFQPIPSRAPALKGNPSSPARVELGKMLYFDPRLSASHLISCSSCHNLGMGGADRQETSVGHGWQRGPRNAPTVFNAVFNVAQFWDGRAEDLRTQAVGPLLAAVEMNSDPKRIVDTLRSIPGYAPLFRRAFPADAEPITFDNVVRALEVFEATLLTPGAPFDRYLEGERRALRASEREGLRLFMDKGCAECHVGRNVGGMDYDPFGVKEAPPDEVRPPGDLGRFKVTNTAQDRYVFRAAPLRNVAVTPPYFHSGKVWKLEDAVRIMGSAQLGIRLTEPEAMKVTTFLRTLTGRPPRIELPILPPSGDATPRPELALPAPG